METAISLLVVGGMSVLAFGLLLGIPMAAARRSAPEAPRYLFSAHLAAIIQGGLLLALTAAVEFSALSANWKTVAVGILLAGMVLFVAGLAVNWLQGIGDGIGEDSLGSRISGLGAPMVLVGAGVLLYGVASAL